MLRFLTCAALAVLLAGCPTENNDTPDTGKAPLPADAACIKQCDGKKCGPDGCGGTCGTCETGTCNETEGTCCTPTCNGTTCGNDGCGGKCTCPATYTCSAENKCEAPCVKDCSGKSCGSDGCGGSCGTCTSGTCNATTGQCDGCTRACDGKSCGADGCGGQCGTCTTGTCNATGQCEGCTRQCTDKECGPDGCGGLCGSCASDKACGVGGKCITADPFVACVPPAPKYTGTFTAEQYCDARAKVICDRLAKCCQLAATSYDACVAYQVHDCDQEDLIARVKAGVTQLEAAKAKVCLDLEAQRNVCDSSATKLILAECDSYSIFPFGKQAQGAKCFDRNDCDKMRCDREIGTCDPVGATEKKGTGGTCQPYKLIGEDCNSTDLYCNPMKLTTNASFCDGTTSKCVERLPAGSACTGSFMCASGTTCLKNKCTNKVKAGQPCTLDDQCEANALCGGATCACTGTCSKIYSGQAGAKCRLYDEAIFNSGMECDFTKTFCKGAKATEFGTCTAFTALGTACTDEAECGPNAACSGNPRVCTARKNLGGSCLSYRECKNGLTCLGNKCTSLGLDGDPCAGDYDCARYGRCDSTSKTCVLTFGAANAACTSLWGPACQDGLFCGTSSTCQTLVADGQTCNGFAKDYDDACASGDCEKVSSSAWVCRPHCSW